MQGGSWVRLQERTWKETKDILPCFRVYPYKVEEVHFLFSSLYSSDASFPSHREVRKFDIKVLMRILTCLIFTRDVVQTHWK